MQEVRARFIGGIKRTQSVRSFRFAPGQKIDFIPGQFLEVIFDEENRDNRELNKYLSFSSSPMKEYIQVTKRLSDSKFSGRLKELKDRQEVLLKAPMGDCIFKDEYKKIGFLIGGIGITPVISMIEYIIDKGLDTDVVLFYSNRTEDDIPFKEELDNWRSINSRIKIFYTVTDREPTDKSCIFGRINRDLVLDKTKDLTERLFFMFGPPAMVEAMKKLCQDLGLAQEKIKAEIFVGY